MDFQRIWQKKKDFQRIWQKKKDFWQKKKDFFFKYKCFFVCSLFVVVSLSSIKKTSHPHYYDLLQTIGLFVTILSLIEIIGIRDKTIEFHREFRSQDLRHRQYILNSEQGLLEKEYSSLAKEKEEIEKKKEEIEKIEKKMGTIKSKIDTIGNEKEENNILKNRLLIEAESK